MSNHTGVVPEWLTKEYLEKMLVIYFGSNSFHLQDFTVSPGSNVGENYISEIFRIKINYLRYNQKETRFIIAKILAKTVLTDELSKNGDVFEVEVNALKKTLPLLYEELTKSIENAEPFFPQILSADKHNRIILLEDLKQNGYQLVDQKKSLDLSHSLLVVRTLASMHASSYLLLKKDPDHRNMYLNCFWENVNGAIVNIIEGCHLGLLKALPKWPLSDEIKRKLNNMNGIELIKKAYKKRDGSFNVLLHGDCWMNNIMFKHNSGKVENVKLIDYQIVNYNSIGLDLNYFIFTSAAEYVKLEHLNDLLSAYYDTFVSISGEIEGFSLETVRKEFRERMEFGLMCQMYTRSGMIGPGAFDLDAQIKKEESKRNDEVYLFQPYIDETVKMLPMFLKQGVL